MNKKSFTLTKKLIMILILSFLTACNAFKQSTNQMGSSFNKLFITKKQVNAQVRRTPNGNKQYVNIDNTSALSNYNIDIKENASKSKNNAQKSKLFKKQKPNTSKEKHFDQNDETTQKEIENFDKAQNLPDNSKKSKFSNWFSKNKPTKQIDVQQTEENSKEFPQLHSLPEGNANFLKKEEMKEELGKLQNEAKEIKNEVNKIDNDTNKIHEHKLPAIQTKDEPKILNDVDDSGFYMNKKPATKYIMNNKSAHTNYNKVKLLPASRYGN